MVSITSIYRLQIWDDEIGDFRNVKPKCNAHGDPHDENGVYYHTSDEAENTLERIRQNPEAPAFRYKQETIFE
jgi:hypothetical protein